MPLQILIDGQPISNTEIVINDVIKVTDENGVYDEVQSPPLVPPLIDSTTIEGPTTLQ